MMHVLCDKCYISGMPKVITHSDNASISHQISPNCKLCVPLFVHYVLYMSVVGLRLMCQHNFKIIGLQFCENNSGIIGCLQA